MELPIATTAKLQLDQGRRVSEACAQTAQLALHPPKPDALGEVMDLATATQSRMAALQMQWMRDWWDWGAYAQTLEGADTIPKFAERTGNIALQAQALSVAHITQFSTLMDNVGVSYSYWVSRQLDRD